MEALTWINHPSHADQVSDETGTLASIGWQVALGGWRSALVGGCYASGFFGIGADAVHGAAQRRGALPDSLGCI